MDDLMRRDGESMDKPSHVISYEHDDSHSNGNLRTVTAVCRCGWRGVPVAAYEDRQFLMAFNNGQVHLVDSRRAARIANLMSKATTPESSLLVQAGFRGVSPCRLYDGATPKGRSQREAIDNGLAKSPDRFTCVLTKAGRAALAAVGIRRNTPWTT
jgi:hypothetical protein